MAITYYPLIPTASQRLKDSQPQILANFTGLNTFLNINHTDFTSVDAGKHKFVQFPNNSLLIPPVNPATSVGAGEVGMYSKNDANSVQQLFVKNGASSEVPLTYFFSAQGGGATTGWTVLFGNLLIKWGQASFSSTSTTVNYNTAGGGGAPAYSGDPYTAFVTSVYNGTSATNFDRTAYFQSFSSPNMNVHKQDNGHTTVFNFLLIGLRA